jgi:1-acyl-sn-glycerol-3-phosphate acyltransferase
MGAFKDGAFKAAIKTGVPIVPITIAYNWKIMPDWGQFGAMPHYAFFRFHTPILTKGLNDSTDVIKVKDTCYQTIERELEARNPEAVANVRAQRAQQSN